MRTVLLGATGFLGRRLLPELSAAGHSCRVLTRYRPDCRELTLIPGVELVQADIHDPAVLERQFAGRDAVFNLVGILNEKGRSGDGFRHAHVALVEKVIAACRRSGVSRLVQVSALHAGQGESHYLRSKGEAEALIRDATDLDSTIVQPSVIFGEGDDFFNRFAALLKLAPILPLACPESRMQPVWVGDVALAMTRALTDREAHGQTLAMVGPQDYSLRELVAFTACAAGLKRRIVGLPDGMARMQARLMDFVPGKPFSTDNYLSLQVDNVSIENCLWRYGIEPRSIENTVPFYLGGSKHQLALDRCRQRRDE